MTILKYKHKFIGDLANGIFTKNVSSTKHLFRADNSYGIDYETFTKELLPVNSFIVIADKDTKNTYITTAKVFEKHGKIRNFGDYGKQIFLIIDKFILSPTETRCPLTEQTRMLAEI